MSQRVLLIGLDGASLPMLSQLASEGLLPNLSRLMTEGAFGELQSVMPPITAPAWVSFMTGKNPGKHGVFEFLKKDEDGIDRPVNSRDVQSRTLWDILSGLGRAVIAVSVPVTYPPRKVNGIMLGGFLTPPGNRDYGYPEGIVDEIEQELGPYQLYMSEVYAPGRVDKILDELESELAYRTATARYLMERKPWECLMVHIWGTDRIQHELWHIWDESHPKHDENEAKQYKERTLGYFRRVDEGVGALIECAGEETDVIVLSDHGFGPVERFMNLNVWLLDRGFLRMKRTPQTLLKRVLFELGVTPENAYKLAMVLGVAKLRLSKGVGERVHLIRRMNKYFLSLSDVDWGKSLAYSRGNYGQIFVNLKGREPHGIVEPGEQYESVLDELSQQLRLTKDPETSEAIIEKVHKSSELYDGPFSDKAPDITFLPRDMRYKALGTVDFTSNRFLRPAYGNGGDHRFEGVLFGVGPSFAKGRKVSDAKLVDVAPTVLHLMGEKVPRDMDGHVLTGALDGEPAHREIQYEEAPGFAGPIAPGDSDAQLEVQEELKKRLRDLGYLG